MDSAAGMTIHVLGETVGMVRRAGTAMTQRRREAAELGSYSSCPITGKAGCRPAFFRRRRGSLASEVEENGTPTKPAA